MSTIIDNSTSILKKSEKAIDKSDEMRYNRKQPEYRAAVLMPMLRNCVIGGRYYEYETTSICVDFA